MKTNKNKSGKTGKVTKDCLILDGVVTKTLPAAKFLVKLQNGIEITANLSGKVRLSKIKIYPGDKVQVEMSTYDLTQGRIVWRVKDEHILQVQ